MIGAGAKILGNIEIGEFSRDRGRICRASRCPAHSTVAGVPAKIVGVSHKGEPCPDMDQLLGQLAYNSFSYEI